MDKPKKMSRAKKQKQKNDFGGMDSMPPSRFRYLIEAVQSTPVEKEQSEEGKEGKFLAVVATNVWRMQRKMLNVETGEAKDEYKPVSRYVESIYKALTEFGVEIKDHDKQKYDDGLGVTVVTSEVRPDLNRREIIETLKPTVRFKDRFLQIGEVVVGIPE